MAEAPPPRPQVSGASLEQALSRARALQEIAYALSRAHGEEAVLRLIVDEVVRVLGVDRAVLIVFDEALSAVEHFVFAGQGKARVQHVDFAQLMEGLSGWVLRQREPAFSPEGQPDPRESTEVQRVRAETGCGGILVLPVQTEETFFATLTVIGLPGQADLAADDVAWLMTLSHHAAAALEQRRLNRHLLWLAQHDALTGLPNRSLFEDRVAEALKRSARSGRGCAVALLDLDGFKAINDSHGHEAGDEVLKAVAARLGAALRASDTVCRLGGDEFTVLAEGVDDLEACARVAEKLRAALSTPLRVAGVQLRLEVSVGCALFPQDGDQAQALLRVADRAMYLDKRARQQ